MHCRTLVGTAGRADSIFTFTATTTTTSQATSQATSHTSTTRAISAISHFEAAKVEVTAPIFALQGRFKHTHEFPIYFSRHRFPIIKTMWMLFHMSIKGPSWDRLSWTFLFQGFRGYQRMHRLRETRGSAYSRGRRERVVVKSKTGEAKGISFLQAKIITQVRKACRQSCTFLSLLALGGVPLMTRHPFLRQKRRSCSSRSAACMDSLVASLNRNTILV